MSGAAPRRLRLLASGAGAPAFNLALDEALLLGGGSAVRLYEWAPPGLSLGYFQRLAELDLAPARRLGFEVVRRPTGGGAIAHCGELTFSVVDAVGGGIFDADVRRGYARLHSAFARALARLGAAARPRGAATLASDRADATWLCFYKSSDLDLVAGAASAARKLLGSAERRIGGRVMHHGSLPLARNPLTPDAACVADLVGRPVAVAEIAAALLPELEAEFGCVLVPGAPTVEELAAAERLVATKYATAEWTARR